MERDTARPLVIALLCIVAIGVAAATLDSTVVPESSPGGGFGGDGGFVGGGDSDEFGFGGSGSGGESPLRFDICFPVLTTLPAVLALVGAFLVLCALVYRKIGWLGPVALVGPVGLPGFLLYALLTSCADPAGGGPGSPIQLPNETSLPSGGSGGFGSGSSVVEPTIPLFVTLLLGVVLLAAVALLFTSSGGEERSVSSEETPPDRSVEAVGRVAGEAADRIESDADLDNEVFRAWREMTDQLDVANPATSTPAEFAAAAVEAGMAPGDVDELTTLFEEVRYGGEAATEAREERAVAALRRIEVKYAEDGS